MAIVENDEFYMFLDGRKGYEKLHQEDESWMNETEAIHGLVDVEEMDGEEEEWSREKKLLRMNQEVLDIVAAYKDFIEQGPHISLDLVSSKVFFFFLFFPIDPFYYDRKKNGVMMMRKIDS